MTQPRRLPVLIAAGLVFLVLIGLGTWQVQRLQWKEALLAMIAERVASPPLSLDSVTSQMSASHEEPFTVEYLPVTVEGTFRHGSERHFFSTWKGETGYYVYTPLLLADGRYLFVNRGFIPYELKDVSKRAAGQVAGVVRITGLSREPLYEKPSALLPDNDPAKNIFYWKDIKAMQASAGLPQGAAVVPLFVDADDAPNPGGLPVGGVTLIDLPNSHLQYAVTWYGLAAALVGVVFTWMRRQRSG